MPKPPGFFPRVTRSFSVFVFLFLVADPAVQAADWRGCAQAKLRQLSLQQSTRDAEPRKSGSKKKGGGKKRAGSTQRAEDIETWLWKNCREYSYELRNLEQEKM